MIKNYKVVGLIAIGLFGLSGCTGGAGPAIKQDSVCVYSNDNEVKTCEIGRLSYFKPNVFGNKQLPINVAASYCDFRHPIVYNDGGVVCVYSGPREFN